MEIWFISMVDTLQSSSRSVPIQIQWDSNAHGLLLLLRWRNYCVCQEGVCAAALKGGCRFARGGVSRDLYAVYICMIRFCFFVFDLTEILYFLPTDIIYINSKSYTLCTIQFLYTVLTDLYKGNYDVYLLFIYVCGERTLCVLVCVCMYNVPRLKTHREKTDTRDETTESKRCCMYDSRIGYKLFVRALTCHKLYN